MTQARRGLRARSSYFGHEVLAWSLYRTGNLKDATREIRRVALKCGPGVINGSDVLLASATLGVLEGIIESDRLNLINARTLALARDWKIP